MSNRLLFVIMFRLEQPKNYYRCLTSTRTTVSYMKLQTQQHELIRPNI
jgi:hypothetical protein